MISVAFSTLSCPDWSWTDLLRLGSEYGYDGVEVRLLRRETNLLSLSEFRPPQRSLRRRELQNAGFKVCGLASSVRFDYADAKQRIEQLAIGRAYVDLAAELEAGFVRVFGDVLGGEQDSRKPEQTMGYIAEGLQSLGEYASDHSLQIVIETHGDYSNTHIVRKTLDLVVCPSVGVLWDTHHPWKFQGESLQTSW
ncbi:MAG: TIM barrel protein, partial [Planctomycetaceae bacterium]